MAEYVIYMVIYGELRRWLCPGEMHITYCLLGEKMYTLVANLSKSELWHPRRHIGRIA